MEDHGREPAVAERPRAQAMPLEPEVVGGELARAETRADARQGPRPVDPPKPAMTPWAHSEAIGEFVAALALAQAAFTPLEKNREADIKGKEGRAGYSYAWADLAAVIDATRPALSANGIAVMQFPVVGHEFVTVTTFAAHKSGQWFRSNLTVGCFSKDPQVIGTAISYARRYALQSFTGVAGREQEDDDGAAAGRDEQDQRRDEPVRPAQRVSQQQVTKPVPILTATGRIAKIQDLDDAGAIGILLDEGGFKATTRDRALADRVRVLADRKAVVRITAQESQADPTKYPPTLKTIVEVDSAG